MCSVLYTSYGFNVLITASVATYNKVHNVLYTIQINILKPQCLFLHTILPLLYGNLQQHQEAIIKLPPSEERDLCFLQDAYIPNDRQTEVESKPFFVFCLQLLVIETLTIHEFNALLKRKVISRIIQMLIVIIFYYLN